MSGGSTEIVHWAHLRCCLVAKWRIAGHFCSSSLPMAQAMGASVRTKLASLLHCLGPSNPNGQSRFNKSALFVMLACGKTLPVVDGFCALIMGFTILGGLSSVLYTNEGA